MIEESLPIEVTALDREALLAAERAARDESEAVRRIGQIISAELDLHKVVQAVTDAATELTGARFGAFFYNVLDEVGASYMLYTLSGVPREAFERFPMPRATDLFGPTFRGAGTVRIADVKKDERYGKNAPHYGMPEGHLPVTSYLAVSVTSRSGEVIGGLFFGHEDEAVFTERAARIAEALAAQAAIAMDNARLFDALERERARATAAAAAAEAAAADNERLYNEARTANRMKDEFLATVSHELRTPLTAILGWTSMLLADMLDDETQRRALETIDRNARAQAQIIEDILDISRIITGKLRLHVRAVDLSAVVEAAMEALRPAADAKDIRLQMLLDPHAGPVAGDPDRLQQVVWNLVSNSVKFTPKGGRIQVRLERVNSHIEIVVSDTGMGIAPEFLPHVFDRFRQADSSTSRDYGGLGIGLAIVLQLVQLHGGSIEVLSPGLGEGATFTVKLPVSILHDLPAGESHERVHPTVGGENVPLTCPPEIVGLRVLIVDDEEDTRTLLGYLLEQCGVEIFTASAGGEAMEQLQNHPIDVLISDIGMPGMDGYELISALRQHEQEKGLKTLPAIALTAYARVEDRMRVLAAGFQMHVPKPVEPAELLTVIASVAPRR